jgi:hypothetical protein
MVAVPGTGIPDRKLGLGPAPAFFLGHEKLYFRRAQENSMLVVKNTLQHMKHI